MRWHILRTLMHKELLRHAANRGGLALGLLLVVAAMLLSFFGKEQGATQGMTSGVFNCFIDYSENSAWVEHLQRNVPVEWKQQVHFRRLGSLGTVNGRIVYPAGSGAIQIRGEDASGLRTKVWIWHVGGAEQGMAPFEAWFWKETQRHFQQQVAERQNALSAAGLSIPLPEIEEERSVLTGGLDPRSGIATALVVFALFFVCVYLLPSLTCEERERGVLLAQALSPASPTEILAAKVLLYPALAIGFAALLAGIYNPGALGRPFFWLAVSVASLGSLGIGLTIASLARTQRSASMGALCYTMGVALLLLICQQNGVPLVSYAALEYHCPRILHAALAGEVHWYHWGNLMGASWLAVGWLGLAAFLFRRFGWQ